MTTPEAGPAPGSTVVITGAAGGIGRALALDAAGRGFAVAAADVDPAGLADLAEQLRASGTRYRTDVVDVADSAAVDAYAAEVFAWSSAVSLVFSNAGIMRMMDGVRPDMKGWREVVDVNLLGMVHMVHAFLVRLVDQRQWAQFVFTGSQASFVVTTRMTPYIATKHAVWGLAAALREELAQTDAQVRVSLFAPGRVLSAITLARESLVETEDGAAAAEKYHQSLADPAKVARLVVDQALARQFWIVPSLDPYGDTVRGRIAELLEAEPTGQL